VRVVRNDVSIGVCASRRLGTSVASGDVLVWLDAHMSFGEHWLEQMLLHADARTVVCSPFWTYELDQCLCWGADFAWNATRDYPSQRYPGFGLRHRTAPPPADAIAVDVPMMIGACYLMRREACEWLGGFSPHFRVWGVDEQDVSARAWMAGMRVRCAVYARVGHLSRTQFPYPVQFEHVEFNQLALIHTLFEPDTVRRLDAAFHPYPAAVRKWLDATETVNGLASWREMVQSRRAMTDAEFFARFVPELVELAARVDVAEASTASAAFAEVADVSA
jgi:GT2 family glycosyltransferase